MLGLGTLIGDFERPLGRIGGAVLLLSAAVCLFNAFARAPTITLRGWRLSGKWLFWIVAIAGYALVTIFKIQHSKSELLAHADAKSPASATLPEPPVVATLAKNAKTDTAAAAKERALDEKAVVGRWLHPVMGIYVIKKVAGAYVLLIESGDGEPVQIHLKEHKSAGGLRLDDPPGHRRPLHHSAGRQARPSG